MAGQRANKIYQQLLVAVYAAINVYVLGENCAYEDCFCADGSIICEDKGLLEIPSLLYYGIQYNSLNLDENYITDIPEGSLPPNLTNIFLDDNPTTTIADAAFDDSLNTLQALSFSSAMFPRIPDAFRRLKALTTLNVQDTTITDWNEEAMMNIGQTMRSLNRDNVGLTSWPNWLQSFSNLTELTITGGSISVIPDDALQNVTDTLTSLNLENNNLSTIPRSLSKCKVLTRLNIQHNKIVDLTWLPQESKLISLSLDNNLISDANHLSNAIYTYRGSLGELDIRSNRLTSIPNISFLTIVKDFDFSYNRIADPYSGSVDPNIESIDFSYNFLRAIPRFYSTFKSLPHLNLPSNVITQIHATDFPSSVTIVDLGNNLITELTDDSFPIKSYIRNLNFNNNPIISISNGALQNVQFLVELNLQGTLLTRLPLALGSVTTLFVLDFSNSDNLVCTCQEKSLEQVIRRIPRDNVSGNCGLVDIYQFFLQFSPQCPSQSDI